MVETRKVTIVIDREIDDELNAIASSSGRDKPSLMREAIVEWLEDQEDIRDAEAVIAQGNTPIPFAEVKRGLELDD